MMGLFGNLRFWEVEPNVLCTRHWKFATGISPLPRGKEALWRRGWKIQKVRNLTAYWP